MHVEDREPGPDIVSDYRGLIATLSALKAMQRRESFRVVGRSSLVVNQVSAKSGQVDKAVRPLRNDTRRLLAQLKRAGCRVDLINT
jgi:hypothetical protein